MCSFNLEPIYVSSVMGWWCKCRSSSKLLDTTAELTLIWAVKHKHPNVLISEAGSVLLFDLKLNGKPVPMVKFIKLYLMYMSKQAVSDNDEMCFIFIKGLIDSLIAFISPKQRFTPTTNTHPHCDWFFFTKVLEQSTHYLWIKGTTLTQGTMNFDIPEKCSATTRKKSQLTAQVTSRWCRYTWL